MEKKLTYRDAGVDIDAGNLSVKLIKDSVKATYRPEVLGDLGGLGGLLAQAEGVAGVVGHLQNVLGLVGVGQDTYVPLLLQAQDLFL